MLTSLSNLRFKQVRVFVPLSLADDEWYPLVLDRVVRPLVANDVEWFWFSRYANTDDVGDCEFEKIPEDFRPTLTRHRSVRIRVGIHPHMDAAFESRARALITNAGCSYSNVLSYPIDELGGDRFLGEDRSQQRQKERILLLARMLHATAELVLHATIDRNGTPVLESNDHGQNPCRSTFESVRHLVCNMTAAPLEAELFLARPTVNTLEFLIRTPWGPAPKPGMQLLFRQPVGL